MCGIKLSDELAVGLQVTSFISFSSHALMLLNLVLESLICKFSSEIDQIVCVIDTALVFLWGQKTGLAESLLYFFCFSFYFTENKIVENCNTYKDSGGRCSCNNQILVSITVF